MAVAFSRWTPLHCGWRRAPAWLGGAHLRLALDPQGLQEHARQLAREADVVVCGAATLQRADDATQRAVRREEETVRLQ